MDGLFIYFFSESRISRKSTMSSGVAASGSGAGGSVLFSLFNKRTIWKMMKANMMKLSAIVMKLP